MIPSHFVTQRMTKALELMIDWNWMMIASTITTMNNNSSRID